MDEAQFIQLEKTVKATIELSVSSVKSDLKLLDAKMNTVHETSIENKRLILVELANQQETISGIQTKINEQHTEIKLIKYSHNNLKSRVSHIHSEHNNLDSKVVTNQLETVKDIQSANKTGVKEWTSFVGVIIILLTFLYGLVTGKPSGG